MLALPSAVVAMRRHLVRLLVLMLDTRDAKVSMYVYIMLVECLTKHNHHYIYTDSRKHGADSEFRCEIGYFVRFQRERDWFEDGVMQWIAVHEE